MNCKAINCNKEIFCKELCKAHYAYAYRHNREEALNHITGSRKSTFNKKDYIGKTFNYWIVLKYIGAKKVKVGNQITRIFLCICECGSIKKIPLNNLKSNRSKSCGCEPKKPYKGHYHPTSLY